MAFFEIFILLKVDLVTLDLISFKFLLALIALLYVLHLLFSLQSQTSLYCDVKGFFLKRFYSNEFLFSFISFIRNHSECQNTAYNMLHLYHIYIYRQHSNCIGNVSIYFKFRRLLSYNIPPHKSKEKM